MIPSGTRTWMFHRGRLGFTLIELLVAISIISLLVSITLGYLTTSRDNARDAAAKEVMLNLRATSDLYFIDNGKTYKGFCDPGGEAEQSLIAASGMTNFPYDCDDEALSWAAEVGLRVGGYFCVDTRSGGKIRTTSKGASGVECPAM